MKYRPLITSPPVAWLIAVSLVLLIYSNLAFALDLYVPFRYLAVLTIESVNNALLLIIVSMLLASLGPRVAVIRLKSQSRQLVTVPTIKDLPLNQDTLFTKRLRLISCLYVFVFFTWLILNFIGPHDGPSSRTLNVSPINVMAFYIYVWLLSFLLFTVSRSQFWGIAIISVLSSNLYFVLDNSRASVVPVAILSVVLFAKQKKILSLVCFLYSLLLLGGILFYRGSYIDLTSASLILPIGLNNILLILDYAFGYTLSFSAFNVAYALESGNSQSIAYIFDSLNPLPSSFLQDYSPLRIDVFRPFPAYAELISVGDGFSVLFLFMLILFLMLDFINSKLRGNRLVPPLLSLWLTIMLSQYNLRASSRVIVLTALLVYISSKMQFSTRGSSS